MSTWVEIALAILLMAYLATLVQAYTTGAIDECIYVAVMLPIVVYMAVCVIGLCILAEVPSLQPRSDGTKAGRMQLHEVS